MNEIITSEFVAMLESSIAINNANIKNAIRREDYAEAATLKENNSVYEWILRSINPVSQLDRVDWVKYSTTEEVK